MAFAAIQAPASQAPDDRATNHVVSYAEVVRMMQGGDGDTRLGGGRGKGLGDRASGLNQEHSQVSALNCGGSILESIDICLRDS